MSRVDAMNDSSKVATMRRLRSSWHAALLCCGLAALGSAEAQTLRLSLDFDEPAWTNTVGEVVDDSTYGLNGTPFGDATTASTSAICRYGVFDGVNEYVEVPDNAALDLPTELTVAAWIYMRTAPAELHTIASKDTNYEYHVDSQRRVFWWWNDSSGNTRSITAPTQLGLNRWYHVAITYESGAQLIYIDGVAQSGAGNYTGALATNNLPFYVATDWNFLSRAFDGYVDEVRVVADALTPTEIQSLRDETQPCGNSASFTITHTGFGIHCVAETVTVDVVDARAGTPLINYNAAVQLDTQSGYGTWGLTAGSGAFGDGTADDGVAAYTWPLGESQATFTLGYPQGPSSINVDLFQVSNPSIRDDDAEGDLVFSPSGFTVTAAALANPPGAITQFATNQTAGTSFALQLAAFGQTASDPVCGIIEGYTGTKSLKFWSQYVDPGTGTRNATIDGVAAAAVEAGAVGQIVTFANGQAAVTAKYKDVGRIRILLKDDTTVNADLPVGITGGTGNFVVSPYDFVLSGIEDAADNSVNPQAVDENGVVFVAAGAPFRATVTVLDSEGDPTPNFGRESSPETVRLATQIVAPGRRREPGRRVRHRFRRVQQRSSDGQRFHLVRGRHHAGRPLIGDGGYLTAGDVTGSASERIGRFIPSHFAVGLNSPLFATTCSAGASLTRGSRSATQQCRSSRRRPSQ